MFMCDENSRVVYNAKTLLMFSGFDDLIGLNLNYGLENGTVE